MVLPTMAMVVEVRSGKMKPAASSTGVVGKLWRGGCGQARVVGGSTLAGPASARGAPEEDPDAEHCDVAQLAGHAERAHVVQRGDNVVNQRAHLCHHGPAQAAPSAAAGRVPKLTSQLHAPPPALLAPNVPTHWSSGGGVVWYP